MPTRTKGRRRRGRRLRELDPVNEGRHSSRYVMAPERPEKDGRTFHRQLLRQHWRNQTGAALVLEWRQQRSDDDNPATGPSQPAQVSSSLSAKEEAGCHLESVLRPDGFFLTSAEQNSICCGEPQPPAAPRGAEDGQMAP